MNWDAIGAVGESLGAVVVFVTLIYLAAQVRMSNKLAEANHQDVHMDRIRAFNLALSQNGDMARIWRIGRASGDLDEDEASQFEAMAIYSILVQRDGWSRKHLLEMPDAELYLDILVDSLSRSPGLRQVWESFSPGNVRWSNEFVEYVNHRLEEITPGDKAQ
jgi:hypothetical protein